MLQLPTCRSLELTLSSKGLRSKKNKWQTDTSSWMSVSVPRHCSTFSFPQQHQMIHTLSAVPTLQLLSIFKLNSILTTSKFFSIIKINVYGTLPMQQELAKHCIEKDECDCQVRNLHWEHCLCRIAKDPSSRYTCQLYRGEKGNMRNFRHWKPVRPKKGKKESLGNPNVTFYKEC